MRFVKPILLGVLLIVVCTSSVWMPDNGLSQILEKLKVYHQHRRQEKIYIHFDRPLYASGENIWFSAYIIDAATSSLDSTSKLLYTELYDTDQKLLKRNVLYSACGIAHGDFHLSDSLPAGNYLVRAYTNYMKNQDSDFFFHHEVRVLNQNTLKSVNNDKTSNSVDLQFFPEGGTLLAGVENCVAFKAEYSHGGAAVVEGDIIDDTNLTVASFKSEHQGMGSFKFMPVFGKRYRCVTRNVTTIFELPEVTQDGFLMRIMETKVAVKIVSYSDRKRFSNAPCRVFIVAQARSKVQFAAEGEIINSTVVTTIPKNRLPSGITQITLFDGAWVPQCERLVFINHQDTINFSVSADTTTYGKRNLVSVKVIAKEKGNMSAGCALSLSVYDESKIQDKDKYPNSINTHLLLTSDLKGRIDEPGYYLKDTLTETKRHTDLLMLTHGWRRFTWKDVLADTLKDQQYLAENGITIKGKLLKTITNRPARNAVLKFYNSSRDIAVVNTDSLGRFFTDNFLYYDSTQFFVQSDNAKGKQTEMVFKVDPFNVAPQIFFKPSKFKTPDSRDFLDQSRIINDIARGYREATLLKSVVVKGKKEEPESSNRKNKLYGYADATIKMKDLNGAYINILQVLQGRVAGVNVMGNTVSIRGGGEPLFLLNGMPMDLNSIMNISMNDVESIDVLKGVAASIYGGRGANGVIAVYTKTGDFSYRPAFGVYRFQYPGLYRAKEFYSPKHDGSQTRSELPDFRNTLYWNPLVKTDKNGVAYVNFYTSDAASKYKIVVEGISINGISGTASKSFIVK